MTSSTETISGTGTKSVEIKAEYKKYKKFVGSFYFSLLIFSLAYLHRLVMVEGFSRKEEVKC